MIMRSQSHVVCHLGYCYSQGYRVQPGFFVQLAAEKFYGFNDLSSELLVRAVDGEFNSEQDDAIITLGGAEWCWWKDPAGVKPPYWSYNWKTNIHYLFYLQKVSLILDILNRNTSDHSFLVKGEEPHGGRHS